MEWIKPIVDYGTPVVITAIVCFAMILIIKQIKRWSDIKLKKIANESNHQVVQQHHDTMKTRLKITPEVKSVLRELLLQTHASRAFVFEFHNGTNNFGGLPFVYMSNTYEVLGQTATSQMAARQKMPFTLYDSLITKILNEEVVTVDTRNRVGDFDSLVYKTIEKRGTTVLICTKLIDEHKRIIGFLGVDFCGDFDKTIFKNDAGALKTLEKIVYREAQALSTLLYVKISRDEKSLKEV